VTLECLGGECWGCHVPQCECACHTREVLELDDPETDVDDVWWANQGGTW
jgi:hypothetical protein